MRRRHRNGAFEHYPSTDSRAGGIHFHYELEVGKARKSLDLFDFSTALIFSGSGLNYPLSMVQPRNDRQWTWNSHFSAFTSSWFPNRHWSTCFTFCTCSSGCWCWKLSSTHPFQILTREPSILSTVEEASGTLDGFEGRVNQWQRVFVYHYDGTETLIKGAESTVFFGKPSSIRGREVIPAA